MKILILNYTDTGGGAAIGAYRLCEALNKKGVYATLGVVKKQTASSFVLKLPKNRKILSVLNRVFLKLLSKFLFKYCFSTTNKFPHSLNLYSCVDVDFINDSDYDLVNLHWICGNTINACDIAKIKKPIVWTMHDSWPACGAEHYQNILESDERYKQIYARKNKPCSTKGFDLCRIAWKHKYKYLHNKPMIFTAPSNWEAQVLRGSSLFGHRSCFVIPNLIDSEIFKPLSFEDKNMAKKIFSLDINKKIICFGAAETSGYDKNSRKGGYFLVEALKLLDDKQSCQLIVFGPSNQKFASDIGIKTFFTGYQSNPEILRMFYAMSDVFVCPSLIENLPFTCLEAICCGTPVVAFDVGGIPDIIEHKHNGYLAKPYDIQDLKNGIEYALMNYESLSKNAFEKSLRDFDGDRTVAKYIEVYENAINMITGSGGG